MRTIGSLFLAATLAASGQELPQAGGEQVYVTAIEVVADVRDAKGALPSDLKPTDFVIIEDGVERTVVGLDYLRRERIAGAIDTTPETTPATPATPVQPADRPLWQNVIYFETSLAHGTGRVTAAKEMMKHVDALVQMGTVDVVFANPTPIALVRNSRDAAAIRKALEKVASSPGSNQLAVNRREYLRDMGGLGGLQALSAAAGRATAKNEFAVGPNNALPYIQQEIAMISDFRESLVAWLSSYRRHTPRNLILMTDGFDLDPVEFYGKTLPPEEQMELRSYVSQSTLGNTSERLARSLASGGWTTMSIPSDNNADGWVDDASVSAIGRVHASIQGEGGSSSPKAFLIRPLDPLHAVSEATGGKIVANSAQIGSALEELDDRVKLTYQVDRKPDGKARKIEVRSRRPNLRVRAARFATSATAEDMAQARALGLLKPSSYLGDLTTEGSITWGAAAAGQKNGTLRAVTNVDLVRRLLPPGAKAHFRITMAVQVGKDSIVVNRSVSDHVLGDKPFRFRTPIDVPSNASMIVLVIEEITTGVWGSTRLPVPTTTNPQS